MRNTKQNQAEGLYGSYAMNFPTVARIETNMGRLAAIVVKENDNRFLTLFADAVRTGRFFRAQVSETQQAATDLAVNNYFGNRVA